MAAGSSAVTTRHPLAIPTLAVVKVNWDDRNDYIQNFVPLVAHCLAQEDDEAVSLGEVQRQMKSDWGLAIPQGALKMILMRAKKDGLVRKEHNVFKKNLDALEECDLGALRESALREYSALIGQLAEFANTRFRRDWGPADAERALASFVEQQIEPILAASITGEKVVDLPDSDGFGSVVVNRFVLDVATNDPSAFGYLETVVKGTVLANVVYMDEAFRSGGPRLSGVEICLDTPFLLRALGFATEEMRSPCSEMLGLLKSQGASLRVFDHTVKEIEGVLDYAARCYRTAGKAEFPGEVIDYFVSENLEASDVEVLIAGLDERLAALGVEPIETPEHTEGIALDEAGLERELGAEIAYRNTEARVKDVQSLTAIHQIRGGQVCHRIESCNALFVTTNTTLVQWSRRYFKGVYGIDATPICISDSALTAIVWLMEPREAAGLPRKQMLANSFAALNPPDKLWRRYLNEIRRLHRAGDITDEDVGLLVFSSEARSELVDLTLGEVEAFAEGTVPEVLEAARASARAGVASDLADRSREFSEEKERREEAEALAVAEAAQRQEAERRAAASDGAHAQRRIQIAGKLSGFIAWGAFSLLASVLLLGSIALALGGVLGGVPSLLRAVIAIAIVVTLAFGYGNAIFGWSARRVVDVVRDRLTPLIARALDRVLAVEPDEEAPEG
jgi:hypothetical protein